MYINYWGLKKHPFDNVPDPEMYFDMHQSVDDAVSEVLFAIEEGDECLAVVVGEVGVGKTMCLRIVLDSLDHEKYRIAFITNPDMTFTQLLREIVGQLEGKQCEETRKDRLFEMFNKILFETNDKGKRVVIFIDEGNVIKPHNLDSLRLLTNMQDDKQNLFTIVLAGQPELGRRLEDPRRANLFQRIGVYCKIHGLDSLEVMKDYIEHRLERAGISGRKIFTDDAFKIIWDNSDKGTPRIINKLCKLSLKAGETNELKEIGAEVINGIASRFMRTYRKQRPKPPVVEVIEESGKEDEEESLPPIQDLPKRQEPEVKKTPPSPPIPAPIPAVKQPVKEPPVIGVIKEPPKDMEKPLLPIQDLLKKKELEVKKTPPSPPIPAPIPAAKQPVKEPPVIGVIKEPVKDKEKWLLSAQDLLKKKELEVKKTPSSPPIPAPIPAAKQPAKEPEKKSEKPVPPKLDGGKKLLSKKEMEDLASKLATERIQNLKNVADPFDEWEKARDEILFKMQKDNSGK
ncbi:MAG: AAA family ATPase [Kiritimatiellae bacterium]|nr:AAA family ATPase [Kiritimatiellia bacterium]MDD5519986.1 AAA family ATPase [Kiritimatiellia bacterium]